MKYHKWDVKKAVEMGAHGKFTEYLKAMQV